MITMLGLQITLTDILAVWGAVISTVLLVREWRKDKRRIAVNCLVDEERIPYPPYNEVIEYLAVEAVNIGHRSVTITEAGFRVDNDLLYMIDSRLPKTLSDGETTRLGSMADDAELNFRDLTKEQLHNCKAFVRDAEGHEYSTKLSNEWINRILTHKSVKPMKTT